jgi:hypothetical protein
MDTLIVGLPMFYFSVGLPKILFARPTKKYLRRHTSRVPQSSAKPDGYFFFGLPKNCRPTKLKLSQTYYMAIKMVWKKRDE